MNGKRVWGILSVVMIQSLMVNAYAKSAGETVLDAEQLQQYLLSDISDENKKQEIINELWLQNSLLKEISRLKLEQDKDVKAQLELARRQTLIKSYWQHYFELHPIQESDTKKLYDEVRQLNGDKQYRLRQIVINDEVSARKVLDTLKGKKSFIEIAKTLSIDKNSAEQGGDLGWLWKTDLLPNFRSVVGLLQPGEYTSPPMQVADKFVIFKLEEVRKQTFPDFEQIKSQLMQTIMVQTQQQEIGRLSSRGK